jgi:urease subunit alpha
MGACAQSLDVTNTRHGIGKAAMKLNTATPHIDARPEAYEVRAGGELTTCQPATVLPMAQHHFLF